MISKASRPSCVPLKDVPSHRELFMKEPVSPHPMKILTYLKKKQKKQKKQKVTLSMPFFTIQYFPKKPLEGGHFSNDVHCL